LRSLAKHRHAYLGDAEIGEDEAAETRRTPDEEHFRLKTRRTGRNIDEVGRWTGIRYHQVG